MKPQKITPRVERWRSPPLRDSRARHAYPPFQSYMGHKGRACPLFSVPKGGDASTLSTLTRSPAGATPNPPQKREATQ